MPAPTPQPFFSVHDLGITATTTTATSISTSDSPTNLSIYNPVAMINSTPSTHNLRASPPPTINRSQSSNLIIYNPNALCQPIKRSQDEDSEKKRFRGDQDYDSSPENRQLQETQASKIYQHDVKVKDGRKRRHDSRSPSTEELPQCLKKIRCDQDFDPSSENRRSHETQASKIYQHDVMVKDNRKWCHDHESRSPSTEEQPQFFKKICVRSEVETCSP